MTRGTGQGTRVSSLSASALPDSVPGAYGHREVWIRGYIHAVVIGCGSGIIARHHRSYAREDMVFDPIHYLPLLEQKIAAPDQAAPMAGWNCPTRSRPCAVCWRRAWARLASGNTSTSCGF